MTSNPPSTSPGPSLLAKDAHYAATLGKYRVLGALGRGGMADVYLAVADGPEGFRKLCVLKMLREDLLEDADFRTMFLDEARLAARLSHPNIVQTFEVDESQGRLLLAMEFVDGQPLTRVLRHVALERFPLEASVRVLCDVLDALEYAHELTDFDGTKFGIVHRDVTPHNVLVGYDARVKLVDFGIAKSSAAIQSTQAGVVKGKVGYMAPEQAAMGEVDGRADIFSIGVMLWELIAQKRLTSGLASGREVLMRRASGGDPRIETVAPHVDRKLAAICNQAMALDPKQRFSHAAEMQTALEGWLKTRTEPARRDISRVLREVFADDRQQLRNLVDERLKGAGISGFPRGFSAAGTSSIFAMNSAIAASLAPPTLATGHDSNSNSIPAKSLSVAPESDARAWLWPSVALVALGVASGTVVYVTQSEDLPPPTSSIAVAPPAPAVEEDLEPVAESEPEAAPDQSSIDPSSLPLVAGSASAPVPAVEKPAAADPGGKRPAVGKPATKPPPQAGKPESASKPEGASKPETSSKPATAPAPSPQPKSTSRAIDEQDPYK